MPGPTRSESANGGQPEALLGWAQRLREPGGSTENLYEVCGICDAGMVRSARLERATHCLEGSCSIHLSYERSNWLNNVLRFGV